mmetsp:Transcript_16595/g.18789  ORF Transcript_16595/g.18789 Transcript_16595/m.18789 type:complete len:244 (+) Transcript_16595:136-867(+)
MFKKRKLKRQRAELRKQVKEDSSGEEEPNGAVKLSKSRRTGKVSQEKNISASIDADTNNTGPTLEAKHNESDSSVSVKKYESVGNHGKKKNRYGPMKAPSNIRVTSRFDYQPDICKDYKETGFCGYGDNCKFLHDRSNYKVGWQIEKEWEEEQRKKKKKLAKGESIQDEEPSTQSNVPDTTNDKPFACLICRQPFVKPVITRCKHLFCQACALKQYSVSPKCYACGDATKGIFNKYKEEAANT